MPSIVKRNLIFLILLLLVASLVASPIMPDFSVGGVNFGKKLRDLKVKLGLDLVGGAHLVYRADMSKIPSESLDSSLEGVRDVIEKRVNAYGVGEANVLTNKSGDDFQIIVDLPNIAETSQAITMIGKTPVLDFREEKTEEDYKMTDEEKEATKKFNLEQEKKAKEVLEKAKAGEDFAKLSDEYSEDFFAKEQKGDLDFFKKGMMVKEFEEVAFKDDFKKDTVWPELIKTQFGWHLLKKTDERGEGDDKEIRASHILLKTLNEELRQETGLPFKLTELSGRHLDRASVVQNEALSWEVLLYFNEEGKELFRQITERNLQKRIAIFLDDQLLTAPTVQAVLGEGKATITGDFSEQEARELVKNLNAGALPVPIDLVSQEKVEASLGKISLQQSLKAGVIGLILVSILMFLLYLLPGLVAVLALVFYAVLMTATFKLLGITLTLSGIAGFVLSLGMAVDGNILAFERIKEELKEGRSPKEALRNGFRRAWPSIRDGNWSTIITCFVLASLGTGMVKGFAITLGIGVAFSMFTSVFISRTIMEFLLLILGKKLFFGLIKIGGKQKIH